MIRHYLSLASFLVFSTLSLSAYAHDIPQAPEGATTLMLQEEASMKVEQDKIIAVFSVEESDDNASLVQNRINKAMGKALTTIKREDDIEVSTGNYNVYLERKTKYNKLEKDIWRGTQTITLESLNKEKILTLSTELQKMGFATKNLSYTLSAEKNRSYRDSLMAEAIKNIQKRALLVSAQLALPSITIAELNLTDQSYTPNPRVMMAEMSMVKGMKADMAPPAIEGKEVEIKVSVHAKVYLEK